MAAAGTKPLPIDLLPGVLAPEEEPAAAPLLTPEPPGEEVPDREPATALPPVDVTSVRTKLTIAYAIIAIIKPTTA